MLQKIVIVFCVFLLGTGVAFPQENDWHPAYRHISVDDGLPSSETYYTYQDRKGYMWFCTDRGVVKYDGYRMTLFTKKQGLLDNVVFRVFEDYKGRIWFHTMNNRVCYYENEKIHPYKYNEIIHQSIRKKSTNFTWLYVDSNDCLYFCVKSCPLLKIDQNGKKTEDDRKNRFVFTKVEKDWVLSFDFKKELPNQGAYFQYDGKTRFLAAKKMDSLFHFGRSLVVQVGNSVFASLNDHVYSVDQSTRLNDLNHGYVVGLFATGNDLWICSANGVYCYKSADKNGFKNKPVHYLKGYTVTSVFRDRQGGYWFSTLENGILYTPSLYVLNQELSKKQLENNLYSVMVNRNYFVVSTLNGVFDFNTKKRLVNTVIHSRSCIANINDKVLIPTTPEGHPGIDQINGMGCFRCSAVNWAAYDDKRIITCGPALTLYDEHGNEEHLYSKTVERDRKCFQHVKHIITAVCVSEDRNLYIGDLEGLYRFDEDKKMFLPYGKIFKGIHVSDLWYDKQWGIIVGTRGKGLYLIQNGKVARLFNENNGLISDQVNSVYVDQNKYLYVCTNEGVSRIFFEGGRLFRIANLTKYQGMNTSEVNNVCEYGGTVYLATKKGLSKVNSDYTWGNGYAPRQIRVSEVYSNGRHIDSENEVLHFKASEKVIRIRLMNYNYKTQGKMPYQYRLSHNQEWIGGNNGEIVLLNPAYGLFDIEIRYKNEFGSWSAPYLLKSIEVLPPFYNTGWFYFLLILLFLLTAIWIFSYRIRVIKRRGKLRRNMELLEQKALLAQMNPHFIFNALNSIQSFLLYNENELAERYLLKLSKLIRMTLTNSRETEITIRRELDSLQMYLELEQMRFKNRFNFEFHIALSVADLQQYIPPMLIQPFVENAIIHGFKGLKEGGEIELNIGGISDNILYVEISDNGHGYEDAKAGDSEDGHKSYGTQITSERLNLFKEKYQSEFQFTIEKRTDEEGNTIGTRVKITIPVFGKNQ